MEQPNRAIYWCLVSSISLLANSFPTSIAYDRPVNAVVLVLFATGALLIATRRWFPSFFRLRQESNQDVNLQLEELASSWSVDVTSKDRPAFSELLPWRWKTPRVLLVGAVASLVLRIELFRRILTATECTITSLEVFIPLVLSIYDSLAFQRSRSRKHEQETQHHALQRRYLDSRFKLVLPTLMVSIGCHLTSGLWSGASSTYICPLVVGQTQTVPLMQLLAASLDCFLAISAYELCLRKTVTSDESGANTRLAWGSVMLSAAALWIVFAFTLYFVKPEYRDWLVPLRWLFDPNHVFALTWQFVLFATVCLCSAHCIVYLGVLELAVTLTAVCVMLPSISFLWSYRRAFPPIALSASVWSFILIIVGYLWFQNIRGSLRVSRYSISSTHLLSLLALFLVLFSAFSRPSIAYVHPIDLLLHEARSQHDHYESYATQSHNLEEAAAQYRRRYGMTPPPGFDVWYEYASARNSLIMDQYDQIYSDVLPFWSVPPEQLRRSTWELISNPWNDVGGIKIRSGSASVFENVPGTHRWMLDGVATLINKFAQHLPDMDLVFNRNDEARVAVPRSHIEHLRNSANAVEDRSGRQSWSGDRASGWLPIREEPYTETILEDMAFQNTFLDFGSIRCDPSSPARSSRDLYTQSHLCLTCISPHSLGQFLSNWTLSADVCHQPDMAYLHGFYLSPAAFRDSHTLVPIFSQSKPHGFHDILYPSAWNYMDKVIYAPTDPSGEPNTDSYNPGHPDPPFEAKQNTLFWRGATSEGGSSGNRAWRGMTRQRLVHLANNLTSSAHDMATILLPTTRDHQYRYTTVPGHAIPHLGLSTDIAIVDNIARCGGIGLHDCTDQEAEFGLVPPTDFQSHWQYRYLFDLDGAGFSGRFLSFLHSHSLPFKTALFREWYDERITAWHHFVPQDMRLHAVWSTLAYFAGVNGTLPGGRRVYMEPHLEEGERIAEQGREWAGKVLRKEDMEVYFFRVLLEWGRLTDDNREEMGFVPSSA